MRTRLDTNPESRSSVAWGRHGGGLERAAATYPVEIYTAERLTEFQRMNEEGLKGFTLK